MQFPGARNWRAAEAVESPAYWADRLAGPLAGPKAPGGSAAVLAARKARALAAAPVAEPQARPAEAPEPPAARRLEPSVPVSDIPLQTEA